MIEDTELHLHKKHKKHLLTSAFGEVTGAWLDDAGVLEVFL